MKNDGFEMEKIELLIERSINWSKNLIIALKVNSHKNILNDYSSNPLTMKDNFRRIVTNASSQSSSQSLVFFHYINYLRFNLSPNLTLLFVFIIVV